MNKKLAKIFFSRAAIYSLIFIGLYLVARRVEIHDFYTHYFRISAIAVLALVFAGIFATVCGFFSRKSEITARAWLATVILALIALVLPEGLHHLFSGRLIIFGVPFGQLFSAEPWFFQAAIVISLGSLYLVEFINLWKIKFNLPKYTPWIIFAFGAVIYGILSIQRHQLYHSFTMDLGGYDQAVYILSRFKNPASTIYNIKSLLGDHFEPILAVLSPLYWIWSDARMILAAQAIIVALGTFPLYALAKKHLKSDFAGLAVAVAYLLFIGIQDAMEFDFHPLALVPPLLAYMFWFFDEKKYGRYFISVFIALLMKEVVAIYVTFFGLYALARKRWKVAIATIAIGVIWYILAVKLMIPWLSGKPYGHIGAYHDLGAGPVQIIETLIIRPFYALKIMFEPGVKTVNTLALVGSFAFLPLFAPVELILILPMLGEKFLTTDRSANWIMWWHYSATIAAPLAIGAILGIKNLAARFKKSAAILVPGLALSVMLCSIAVSFVFYKDPPYTVPLAKVFTQKFYQKDQHLKDLDKVLAQIPRSASVATQDSILPHVSTREKIYRIHPEVFPADYVILDYSVNYWPYSDEDFSALVVKMGSNPDYSTFYANYPLYIYKKK